MAYVVLIVAGLLEVVWAASLKNAVEGRSFRWGFLTLVAMGGSVGLLAVALRRIPLGTAYAIWVGVGVAGTCLVGIMLLGEPASRTRIACLALLIASVAGLHLTGCTPASAPHPPTTHGAVGIHGMVLFGRDAIFASHMPLYHPPHDAQVVLRLEADDRDTDAALRAELARGGLVTLMPKPFDLARLDPSAAAPLREITGAIYRGHFERGGVVVRAEARFHVAAIIVRRSIDAYAPAAPPSWIAFGSGREGYLLHVIGRRPEVDLIVAVDGSVPTEAATLEGSEDGARMPSTPWLARHGLRDPRVIYREDEDLR